MITPPPQKDNFIKTYQIKKMVAIISWFYLVGKPSKGKYNVSLKQIENVQLKNSNLNSASFLCLDFIHKSLQTNSK
jgi:hypothetical protein